MRACLGSAEGRVQALAALTSAEEANVRAAQAYLRRRPLTDAAELQQLARRIADMPAGEAQVLALETLGRHYVSDREVLMLLAQLYARTPSVEVQNAIAGVLLRADRRPVGEAELRQVLQEHRRAQPGSGDMVDALLARIAYP
jgi:hypothetical protein